MDEQALCFAVGGDTLLGVLTPAAAGQAGPASTGLLVVVGGPQYRAGSHRQFVHLARHVAAAGWPALRFDVRGMGDSDGAQRSFEALDDDLAAAIDAFVAAAGVRRVVLLGLCDGASAALMYEARRSDPRVAGLALLNPWARSEATLARTHVRHYYWQRLRQRAFWLKMFGSLRAVARAGGDLARNLKRASAASAPAEDFRSLMAQGWRAGRGPVLLVISTADLTAREFLDHSAGDAAWQRAFADRPPTRVNLEGADHTCSTPAAESGLLQAVAGWLGTHFAGAAAPAGR